MFMFFARLVRADFLLCCFLCCAAGAALAADKVRLQLKWQHQFQFAGYYAAQAQGYYREAGLEVEIVPARPGDDAHRIVLDGRAEFGVGTTDLLLLRSRGEPVVVLGVIFQHSPLALATLMHSGTQGIHDLAGRKLMIEPGSAELFAYLRREGLTEDRFTALPHTHSVRDLIGRKVDAMSVYTTDEPFEMIQEGYPVVLHSPRTGGIDFYGDNLFTTETQIARHPERVKAFRAASLKGWKYAMAHPEEIAALIHAKYSARHTLAHLEYEIRQMIGLLQADIVEPGHMYAGRWRHIAAVYAELGMLDADFDPEGFLYDPAPRPPDMTPWLLALGGMTLLLFAVGGTAYYILRVSRRLRAGEKRWRNLFDVMPIAMIVTDYDKRVVAWNAAATRIFGFDAGEALGQDIYALLVPEDQREHVHRVLDGTLREHATTESLNRNRTRSGAIITCEWRNALYLGDDGRPAGAISLGMDVSERIEMLRHLNEAKDVAERLLSDQRQFLGMVSHEIRSPLAAIDAASQVLELRCMTRCGSDEVIGRVRRGVKRLFDFVNNCLADDKLNRIEREGLQRTDDIVELPTFLASVVDQAAQNAARCTIDLACAPDVGAYRGDASLLRIMLHNLLDNACKYSPPETNVRLRADRESDGELVLTVEDGGPGIPPEDMERLGQRYFRGANRDRAGGAGLGLSLVERIVKLHGGRLVIDSTPGAGTTATVRLPEPAIR